MYEDDPTIQSNIGLPTVEGRPDMGAHHFRAQRLREGAVGDFVRHLQEDPEARQMVAAFVGAKAALADTTTTEPGPHRALTPFVAGLMSLPRTRRAFMEAIDATVATESARLKQEASQDGLDVDVLIVGAGPQAAVAAARLRAENHELSVLTVDKRDHLGGQFRGYGTRPSFRINSRTHRPQDVSAASLPGGDGNLNPLGETAVVQVPDFTTVTYPTNTEVGDAAATNLYFSTPAMLGVEFVGSRPSSFDDSEIVTLEDAETGAEYRVRAQSVLALTGAGERKVAGESDKVWTAERLFAHFGNENEMFPMKAFAGKKVAIIGGGDSGRVAAELLTRLGPPEAYGGSTAQLGGPEAITWYGTDFETREGYCETNRSRYTPLEAFIANPGEELGGARLIRPLPVRVTDIEEMSYGSVRLTESNNYRYFDIVIDARNLQDNTPPSFSRENAVDVQGDVLGVGRTNVGRKMASSRFYVGGPVARISLSAVEKASFADGIRENALALWANVPRVDNLAKYIAERLTPAARR